MHIPGFTADATLTSAPHTYHTSLTWDAVNPNSIEPAGEACFGCRCRFQCSGSGVAQDCSLVCFKLCLYCEDLGKGQIRCVTTPRPCQPAFYTSRYLGS